MLKGVLILLAVFLFLAPEKLEGGKCNASADSCTAFCAATAPPLGATVCKSGDNYAECQAYDMSGKKVFEIRDECEVGDGTAGGGGTGGGGGSVDPLWCALNWWICDPFAN